MPTTPRSFQYRHVIAAVHDAAMAGLSFLLSVYVRLGDDHLHLADGYLEYGTALFTLICVAVFISMQLYRGLWRYASMRDLIAIVRAVTLSVLIFAAAMFVINRLEGIPRSLLFINWLLLLFLLGAPRFIYRAVKDHRLTWRLTLDEAPTIPVLLVGATDDADRFIRDMERLPDAPYRVVAIADDSLNRRGSTLRHVPIYGNTAALPAIIDRLDRKGLRPQKIIIADASAAGVPVRNLLAVADSLGVPLARLPRSGEVRADVGERREVQAIAVEDLLGRPQNVLDRESMRRLVEGKIVLITGAGGTIGSELARQVAELAPRKLLLLDACEFNLYRIERELRRLRPDLPLIALLADVRDKAHIRYLFAAHKPALVFHAAAVKHVPVAELNVEEAVLTNVFGTQNVAEACRAHGVGVMVLVSTDKAVNPANVMGASKRLAETLCRALAEPEDSGTQFIVVRFGNVLGSTGSVVPLFQEQLAQGGPLTVTHPEMTRYFMTTREAVELVLQAAALGNAQPDRRECVFVLDMGSPVRILDLARQMIRLAGLKPEADVEIITTGLRPGEKLHEELFYFSENAVKTAHESIYLTSPQQVDANALQAGMKKLFATCHERKPQEVKKLLKDLVPEYVPASH